MIVKTNYKFTTLPSTQERNKEVKRILGIDDGNKICDLDSLAEIVDILNKTSCKKVFLEVETCQDLLSGQTYKLFRSLRLKYL